MSEQPPWDPYGQLQDDDHYQGQPPYQGQPDPPQDAKPPYRAPPMQDQPFQGPSQNSPKLTKLTSRFDNAKLSHAQRQISAARTELSAEQQQVSADEAQISTLQSTVDGLPSDPLKAFTSMVCSNPDVYDSSTGQTITAQRLTVGLRLIADQV